MTGRCSGNLCHIKASPSGTVVTECLSDCERTQSVVPHTLSALPTRTLSCSLICLFSLIQVLVNSNLGCKVSGFRPLQEDKIEAIYTTLVRENVGCARCFGSTVYSAN